MSEQILRSRGFLGGLCLLISVLAIHSARAYRVGLSVPDSPGGEAVRAVAVGPADPDLLFIATDRGAYRSGDWGTTWSALALGVGDAPVNAFVVDPSNPDRVYAATWSGMFESADGGATWSVIPGGIAGFEIRTLAVDPRDSRMIVAGTEHGLFVSKDRGRTWQSPAGSTVPPEPTAFAIDLSRGFAVYAGTAYGGVFASRDGGRTWIPDGSGLSSTHVFSLAVDPGDPDTIYAATNFGLVASSDGGSTWSFFHNGTGNAYLYALSVGRAGTDVIYGGTEHGIYVSEDKGWSWRPLSGQYFGDREMATRARGADSGVRLPRIRSAAAEPPAAGGVADPDRDGLSSETESGIGTDPDNPDSDGDGIRDGLDPDIVAGVVAALPDTVFKSDGPGLRTAMLARLENIERATAAGHVDVAVGELQNLLLRVDGCPPLPDPDDWVVDCAAQLTVRNLLRLLAGNHSSWTIDSAVVPSIPSLPGLAGGPPRQTAAVKGPNGDLEEFVVDEVNFRPASAQELNDFLARYNGAVLRGSRPLLLPGTIPPSGLPEDTGWYLVRVDLQLSPLDDLPSGMEKVGLMGRWSFSSESAARLFALAAREYSREISPNYLVRTAQITGCGVCEHPLGGGNYIAAERWWWMTEDDNAQMPGVQGLSIGVVHAWKYLKYKGYPPKTPYTPVRLAIIDGGFDLDEKTGAPMNGNKDYLGRPDQLDEIDQDWTAGGISGGGSWHGQMTFGIAAALSGNQWGTAGISGGWEVRPILIKVAAGTIGDFNSMAWGLYDALYNGADVISMSISGDCGYSCVNFAAGNVLKAAVGSARNLGSVVVAAAGNEGQDISNADRYPCELAGVICVGAVGKDGRAMGYSNYGSVVDIWAPAGVKTTVTRDSAAADLNDIGADELYDFGGTSCATPFVAGIVALMKMFNKNLGSDQVCGTLQDTVNSSSDTKVAPGYVDAFRAVAGLVSNGAPTVKITAPAGGASIAYQNVYLEAQVKDPESPNQYSWGYAEFDTKLVFSSNIDGELCSASGDATGAGATLGCDASKSLTPGTHVITAAATDPFGATTKATVTVNVKNTAPIARITFPTTGSSYYTSQAVNLRGFGFDPDQVIEDSYLVWESSIKGYLGWGKSIWVSDLPKGSHTITLTARDVFNATGTDGIVLNMVEGSGYPTAKITSPANNTMVPGSNPSVTLQGSGTDPEDGDLPDASLKWTSDKMGDLGTGKSLTVKLTTLGGEQTSHVITLEVTDTGGNKATHSITVVVMSIG